MRKLLLIIIVSLGSSAFAKIETLSCSTGNGIKLCKAMEDLTVKFNNDYEVSEENLSTIQNLLNDTVKFNTEFSLAGDQSVYYDVTVARKAVKLCEVACGKTLVAPSRLFDSFQESFNVLMQNMSTVSNNSGYYIPSCGK